MNFVDPSTAQGAQAAESKSPGRERSGRPGQKPLACSVPRVPWGKGRACWQGISQGVSPERAEDT